jgi:hypothetical protein
MLFVLMMPPAATEIAVDVPNEAGSTVAIEVSEEEDAGDHAVGQGSDDDDTG